MPSVRGKVLYFFGCRHWGGGMWKAKLKPQESRQKYPEEQQSEFIIVISFCQSHIVQSLLISRGLQSKLMININNNRIIE